MKEQVFILCFWLFMGFLVARTPFGTTADQPQRVRMRDMEVLHFSNGASTVKHVLDVVPQMNCVGGSGAKHADKVRTAACKNAGWDGSQTIWRCEMELPKGLEIGQFEVVCEDWSDKTDGYVATGSCALDYELVQTAPLQARTRSVPKEPVSPIAETCDDHGDVCTTAVECRDGVCTHPTEPDEETRRITAEEYEKQMADSMRKRIMKNKEEMHARRLREAQKKSRNMDPAVEVFFILLFTFLVMIVVSVPLILLIKAFLDAITQRNVDFSYCPRHSRCSDSSCEHRHMVRCRNTWVNRRRYGEYYWPASSTLVVKSSASAPRRTEMSSRRAQSPRAPVDPVNNNSENGETKISSGFGASRTRLRLNTPPPAEQAVKEPEEEGSVPEVSEKKSSIFEMSSGFGGSSSRSSTSETSGSSGFGRSSAFGGSSRRARSPSPPPERASSPSSDSSSSSAGFFTSSGFGGGRTRGR